MRTMITLFISMTYSNYYKILRFLWSGEVRRDSGAIGVVYATTLRAIPRVIATAFMFFLGIFILIMDCILVAVCVDAFSEHRSKTAKTTMKQEIANLESAFDFLCSSAGKKHITKAMWMEILLASGRRAGSPSKNHEFVEASILIFEVRIVEI